MKLEVHKNGVKLFFITFAVMGRRQILSRLIDEQSRPELLPLGEVVKSGLLAIHQVWSAVGVSDYVIMPDHVHFLMVVDFLRAPSFNPLWATHRLLDAIERGWDHRGLAPAPPKANSGLVTQPRNGNPALNSALAVAESVANIDMITELKAAVSRGREMAAALKLGESSASGASSVAQAGCGAASGASSVVQAGCGAASGASSVAQAGCGAASPDVSVIFERSPWLDLAFDPRQLKAIRQYIRLNPARALWKLKHPDLFVCHRGLKTARLSRFSDHRFDGVGNLALLGGSRSSRRLLRLRRSVRWRCDRHRPQPMHFGRIAC